MIRKNMRKTACAFALVLCVPVAAYACDGPACPAPAEAAAKVQPRDVMQFMREQAASTRSAQPRRHAKAAVVKPKVAIHRTAAAKPTPAPSPVPSDAAAAFAANSVASQQDQVPVLAREQFNAIDSAAPAPFAETTGVSAADDPNVQVVAAAEFNDIDRKADQSEASPFPSVEVPIAAEPAKPSAAAAPAAVSWLQWLWSAVTGTLTALAAAVRQLAHV
jgi:hypothetical protein